MFFACFISNGQTQDSLQQLWEARFKQIKLEDSLYKAKVFFPGEKIEIEFYLKGREIPLNNDFEIFFVVEDSIGKTIIKPIIENNGFLLPDLKNYEMGIFAIKYKKKVYAKNDYINGFKKNNSVCIIFDSKPYTKRVLKDKYNNNVFWQLEYDTSLHRKKTKAFLSISYNRTGIVSTTLIFNKKMYFEGNEKLIR